MLTLHIAVSNMQKVSILIDAIKGMMWQCIDMCRRWYNILGANEPMCPIRYLRRLFFYSAVRAEALASLVDYTTQWRLRTAQMKSGMTGALDKLRDKITELKQFGDEYEEEVRGCVEALEGHPEWEEMWVDP